MRKALVAICLPLAVLAGCFGGSSNISTQAPIPTPTSTRPAAPTSTPTEAPVAFLLPTATPAPTATPKTPSCAEQSLEFVAQTNALLREWDDALKLAEKTPRIQLPDQIDKLQALRRQAEDIPVPGCAVQVQEVMVSGMRDAIYAFLQLMTQNQDVRDLPMSVLLSGSWNNIRAGQHVISVMPTISGSWQPVTTEDVKQLFPQYTWEDHYYSGGDTAIQTTGSPIRMDAYHENASVYKVIIITPLSDPTEYPTTWQPVASTVATLLPYWHDRDSWLADFGAIQPTVSEYSKTENIDVTTLSAASFLSPDLGMAVAVVAIYVPRQP